MCKCVQGVRAKRGGPQRAKTRSSQPRRAGGDDADGRAVRGPGRAAAGARHPRPPKAPRQRPWCYIHEEACAWPPEVCACFPPPRRIEPP